MILGILTSCADVGSERSCTEGSDVEALVPSRSLDISLPDQSYQPPSIQKASLPVLPSDNGGLAYNLTPTLEEVKEDIVECNRIKVILNSLYLLDEYTCLYIQLRVLN